MDKRIEILHFLERYYRLLDQDSHVYDLLLAYVNAWTEVAESRSASDVMNRLKDTALLMQDECNGYSVPAMDALNPDALEDAGILSSELRLFLADRQSLLMNYIQEIRELALYLDHYRTDAGWLDELSKKCARSIAVHKWERAYYYATVNYWFAGWEDGYVHYIHEHLLENFLSLHADMPWHETRIEAEAAMNGFLDCMRGEVSAIAMQFGKEREELYKIRQEIKEWKGRHNDD